MEIEDYETKLLNSLVQYRSIQSPSLLLLWFQYLESNNTDVWRQKLKELKNDEEQEGTNISEEERTYHRLCNYDDNLDLLGPPRPYWLFQFELSLLIPGVMEQSLFQLLLLEFMSLEQISQPSPSQKKKLECLQKESRSVLISTICKHFINSSTVTESSNFASRIDRQTIHSFVVKLIEETMSKKIPTRTEKDKFISGVINLFTEEKIATQQDESLAKETSFAVFTGLEKQLYSLAIEHFYHTTPESLYEESKDPKLLQQNRLILASRLISGCLRHFLCLYFVQLEKQRDSSKKKEVDLQFVRKDYPTILEHISYTISLAQIIQRERFHLQNIMLQEVAQDAVQKSKNKIDGWENVMQEELNNFFDAYRWLENKTKKQMDIVGISYESLTFLVFNRVNMILLPKRQAQTFTKKSKTAAEIESESTEANTYPTIRSHMDLILKNQVIEVHKLHTSESKINEEAIQNPSVQSRVVVDLLKRKSFVE